MSTKLLKSKDVRTRDELADLLEALATRVRAGQLVFEQGTEEVLLDLPESVQVDLEASESVKSKGSSRKLGLKLKWPLDAEGAPADAVPPKGTTAD